MKHKISTIVGPFSVYLGYQPTPEDYILNRFTEVINNVSLPLFVKFGKSSSLDVIIQLINEAELEHELYECTRAGDGAGVRINLSLEKREITLDRW